MAPSSPPDDVSMSDHRPMTRENSNEGDLVVGHTSHPARHTMLRKETLEVYQSATSEVNQHVAQSVAHLRGETFSWAQACNQKIDVTANEVMNAVGSELTTSNRNLESLVEHKS